MMFGEVISHVENTLAPDEIELFLFDAIFDPVESRVKSFGEFLSHF